MTYLTSRGRDLVQAGRQACQPTYADRTRIQGVLMAKLGGEALPPDPGLAATAVAAGRSLWPIVSIVVVSLGIVGGAYLLANHSRTQESSPEPVAMNRLTAEPGLTEKPLAPIDENPAPVKSTPAVVALIPAPPLRPAQDRLAAEVALLSRATRDLRAGRASEALKALDEYRRKFPKGLLDVEQRTARAQVLCALGRFQEADTKIAELDPRSPSTARAKQYCDGRLASR
jgi:hypothetical protein